MKKIIIALILGLLAVLMLSIWSANAANISSSGTGYVWYSNTSATSNSNRVATTAVNDGVTNVEYHLIPNPPDNTSNAWEATGIVWSTTQANINKVEYTNGSWFTPWGGDGAFTTNFKLQSSTNGTTWTDVSGWTLTPSYDYDSPNAAWKKYTFTGSAISVQGIRVVGQVHTTGASSWFVNGAEVAVYNDDGATPTPTPTPVNTPTPTTAVTPTPTPQVNPNRPDHVVIVVEENQKLQDILRLDYFTYLATQGATMVNLKAVAHPSEPDYLALFSGSTQGVTDDSCPPSGYPLSGNNLGKQLVDAGFTFKGYSESQPANPLSPCINGAWRGYHSPWFFFSSTASYGVSFNTFPSDYSTLPTVSFVIPNANNDMHDGTLQQGSDWLKTNLEAYRAWAMTHNSLLIVTFDEDDESADNTIYTVFAGEKIRTGIYNESLTLYNILTTIENLYGLSRLNTATPIVDIFK